MNNIPSQDKNISPIINQIKEEKHSHILNPKNSVQIHNNKDIKTLNLNNIEENSTFPITDNTSSLIKKINENESISNIIIDIPQKTNEDLDILLNKLNSKQQNLNKETSNYIQNIEEKNTVNKTGYVLRKKKKRYGFSNSEGINCHMCGEIKPINKVITCCIPNCRESFCTKCLKKHYTMSTLALLLDEDQNGIERKNWKCFKCKKRCKCEKCKNLYKQNNQSSLNKNDTKEETQSNITFLSTIKNKVKKNQKNKKIRKIKIFLKSKKNNKHNVFNNFNIIEFYDDENNQSNYNNNNSIKSKHQNYNLNHNNNVNNNIIQIEGDVEKDYLSIKELKELIEKNKNKYLKLYEKCLNNSNQSNIECDLCGLDNESIENFVNFQNGKNFLEFFFHFFANYDFLITTKTQNEILFDTGDIFQLLINYQEQNYGMRNICKCCILKIANSKFNFNKIYMSIFSQKIKKETDNKKINLTIKNYSNYCQKDKIEKHIIKYQPNKSNILKIPLYGIPIFFNSEFLIELKLITEILLNNIKDLIKYIKGNGNNESLKNINDLIIKNFQNLISEYLKINNYIESLKIYAQEKNQFKMILNLFDNALINNNQNIERLKGYYEGYQTYFKQYYNINQNLYSYFSPSEK